MSVTPIDRPKWQSSLDRIPPANLDAEMAVLGAVLVDRTMMDVVADVVQPGDFHAPLHETIFVALCALHEAGAPLDKVALAEELRRRGMLDKIGGMAYVNTLMDAVPTASSAEYYAKIVREKAIARALIAAGRQIMDLGYDCESDVVEGLTGAERALSAVTERGEATSRMPQQGEVLDQLVREMQSSDPVRVMLSPWKHLNDAIGGFSDGELVAIVAPAKVGKTGFAVTLAEFIAEYSGPLPFFATEMGDRGIERRRIALLSGVSARKQRLKQFARGELDRAVEAAKTLRDRRMIVVAREHRSLRGIWRVCRDLRKRMGALAGIAVDHVGFVEEARAFGKDVTETQALDGVYRELLNIADHFACPVFVVVHPNRDGSMERPSRSTLQKIRGGGALENHAHTILCPWRTDPIATPEKAELIIVASRDGGEGALPMHYDGARAGWFDLDGSDVVPLWFEDPAKRRSSQMTLGHDDAAEDVSDVDLDDARALFGAGA